MLKKIAVVCSLVMLLSTVAMAGPSKGKIVVTVPIVTAQGLVGMGSGYDGYDFGDNGAFSLCGTGQVSIPGYPASYGTSWSFGYLITDNLELGLNISFVKRMSKDDPLINLGFFGAYYLKTDGLMPFIKAGVTRYDIREFDDPSRTIINSSVGIAYAVSGTVAPYFSIDFETIVDTGTLMSLTLGLKFMF